MFCEYRPSSFSSLAQVRCFWRCFCFRSDSSPFPEDVWAWWLLATVHSLWSVPTVAQWSEVLFSDKSNFGISFVNQGLESGVWRKSGEAQNLSCLTSSVKFPQSGMIWGAVTSAGVGPLCFIMSKINAGDYQEILEHSKLVSRWRHNGDADFLLQQDFSICPQW